MKNEFTVDVSFDRLELLAALQAEGLGNYFRVAVIIRSNSFNTTYAAGVTGAGPELEFCVASLAGDYTRDPNWRECNAKAT